jgi:hypothetical protein
MRRTEIEQIRSVAGAYAREALEARKAFLELRLRQDPEVRRIFIRLADDIADTLRQGGSGTVDDWLMTAIEGQLRYLTAQMRTELTDTLHGHIAAAVEIGSRVNRAVTIDLMTQRVTVPGVTKQGLERMYVRVNERAVRAHIERTSYGLKLSDRIWDTSNGAGEVIRNILEDAIATGQDAVATARALERYARGEADTMVKYYEGMMRRMDGRVPEDLSYNALRTARTETTAALGQGTIASARASPSCTGIKFCLSAAHKVRDICDELAAHDVGLGLGVYALDDPPPYPAHPNTLSFLVEVHTPVDQFVSQLREWIDDPDSHPALSEWYATDYMAAA